jgi:hypothetical protein
LLTFEKTLNITAMIDLKEKNNIKKSEIELVENQKQEYKIFGRFMRTKGLQLFSYDHLEQELSLVEESKDEDVKLVLEDGKLKPKYNSHTEASINTNHTHFEALNLRTANKRVEKYKSGKIKDLCNLKKYEPKPIYNF